MSLHRLLKVHKWSVLQIIMAKSDSNFEIYSFSPGRNEIYEKKYKIL